MSRSRVEYIYVRTHKSVCLIDKKKEGRRVLSVIEAWLTKYNVTIKLRYLIKKKLHVVRYFKPLSRILQPHSLHSNITGHNSNLVKRKQIVLVKEMLRSAGKVPSVCRDVNWILDIINCFCTKCERFKIVQVIGSIRIAFKCVNIFTGEITFKEI